MTHARPAFLGVLLLAACTRSHALAPDVGPVGPPEAGLADGATGVDDDAPSPGGPVPGAPGGRILRWGYADFLDAFVFEPGIVLVHATGVWLVSRDGRELARWDAPSRIISWSASSEAIAIGLARIVGEPTAVVLLTPHLEEWVRYEPHLEPVGVWLYGRQLEVRGDSARLAFHVPDPDPVEWAYTYSAASVDGECRAERIAFGASVGERQHIQILCLWSAGGRYDGGALGSVEVVPPLEPVALAFSGPEPGHVVAGNGDVFAIDRGACVPTWTPDCFAFLGQEPTLRSSLGLGPARTGDSPTVFALSTGLLEPRAGDTYCDPADILRHLGAPRCRLVHWDPGSARTLWTVDWDRPVVTVPAVEHDPWGGNLVVATFGEWAAAGLPRAWAVELVPLAP